MPPEKFCGPADARRWLVCEFVPRLRRGLDQWEVFPKRDAVQEGGQFLVACGGHLFEMNVDYAVLLPLAGYAAVGCGYAFALGAFATLSGREEPAAEWAERAAEAAVRHSPGCERPIHLASQKAQP